MIDSRKLSAVLIALALATPITFMLAGSPMLSGCVSSKVDSVALVEPAQLAWPSIEKQFLRGVEDAEQSGDIAFMAADNLREAAAETGRALSAGDDVAINLIPWSAMRPFAERAISKRLALGEIGPGVAESFLEQLRNFDETMAALKRFP